jgi:hypothetical protein
MQIKRHDLHRQQMRYFANKPSIAIDLIRRELAARDRGMAHQCTSLSG